jgi:hypothetical protein
MAALSNSHNLAASDPAQHAIDRYLVGIIFKISLKKKDLKIFLRHGIFPTKMMDFS